MVYIYTYLRMISYVYTTQDIMTSYTYSDTCIYVYIQIHSYDYLYIYGDFN